MRWNFLSNAVLVKYLRPQRNSVLDDSETIQYLQFEHISFVSDVLFIWVCNHRNKTYFDLAGV